MEDRSLVSIEWSRDRGKRRARRHTPGRRDPGWLSRRCGEHPSDGIDKEERVAMPGHSTRQGLMKGSGIWAR